MKNDRVADRMMSCGTSWPLENEGTREARGQGLDDSRTQHDLRHHLRNTLKAEALLPGFCFRGNSFPGLSQRKD